MIRPVFAAATAALLSLSFVPSAAVAGGGASCDITFRIGTSTPMLSASVFAIYLNAPGDFAGTGIGVDCDLLNGTVGQASDGDQPQVRTLTLTFAGTPNPIQGPKDVARCTWIPTSRFPVAGDFNLTSQSGFNTNFPIPGPVNAQITVSDIDCSGTLDTTTTTTSTTITTTSTSTTTTTQEPLPLCGDFDLNDLIEASDALGVLQASVGQLECLLCVCDTNNDGRNTAVDALRTLRTSVGSILDMVCPGFCEVD